MTLPAPGLDGAHHNKNRLIEGNYQMEAEFWHQKWEKNDIGFHREEANPLLVEHFDALKLSQGSRVFLPLCGKTRDIAWLLSQGYRVVGAELSALAVTQLFDDLGIKPDIADAGALTHYRAKALDLFLGDIFDLEPEQLGTIDAIYDRAALVALPEALRLHYSEHLTRITDSAPQLLITYEYDQTVIDGPPFSVSNEEVIQHYGSEYTPMLLHSEEVPGGMKGKCPAKEHLWLLKNSR